MTIKRLEEIIDENTEAAEAGDARAQALVVTAMAELEDVIARNKAQEAERDEWCEGAGVPVDPFTAAFEAKEREENTDFSMLTDEEMEGDW
jgi:glutamyl-tRNA reductase